MLALPKVKHFWWKVCNNALATRVNVVKRKCDVSPWCPICGEKIETIEHLFFECEWAKKVWFGSDLGLKLSLESHATVFQWASSLLDDLKNINCSWRLWREWLRLHGPFGFPEIILCFIIKI